MTVSRGVLLLLLQGLLLNMGISNPVTRHSAGSLYHQELARQLAQFLTKGADLHGRGGMLTLPDVYCLFNRWAAAAAGQQASSGEAWRSGHALEVPVLTEAWSRLSCIA